MTRVYDRPFRAENQYGTAIPYATVSLWTARTGGTQITSGITTLDDQPMPLPMTCDAWGYLPSFKDTEDRDIYAIGSASGVISGVERVRLEPVDILLDGGAIDGDLQINGTLTLSDTTAPAAPTDSIVLWSDNGVPMATTPTDTYALGEAVSGALLAANNLSDVANPGTARVNLGLGIAHGQPVLAYNYGFRCDGNPATAADNDVAIAAAIAAAASIQGRVVLPPGYGYISQPIELLPRVGLEGSVVYGTVLQLATNSNCHMIVNRQSSDGTSDPNSMFNYVANLTLDGRGAHQDGEGPYHGIYFDTNPGVGSMSSGDLAYDASHVVEKVNTRNTKGDGFHVAGRSDVRISKCKATTAGRNGFRIRFDTHLSDCIVEKSGAAGFHIWGSSNQLTNCKAYICGQDASSVHGMTVDPDDGHGFYITGSGIGEVTIAGCDAQETCGAGFYVAGGANAVQISGTIQKSSFGNTGSGWASVVLNNAHNCVIDVTSKNLTGINGLHLTGGSNRNAVTIGHTPIPGESVSEILTSGSALLANRVVGNGLVLAEPGRRTPLSIGAMAWSEDPVHVSTALQPTAGVVVLIRVTAYKTTASNILLAVGTAGTGLTAGQNWAGLYTTAGVLLGQTADLTTSWGTTGEKTHALSAPVTGLTIGEDYFVAILSNGSSTPAFVSLSSGNYGGTVNRGLSGANVRYGTYGTSQTTLPSPLTVGSIAAGGRVFNVILT